MEIYFGKNLKFLRKKNGLSQADLANFIGKGSTTIANWENSVSEPNFTELTQIANYFKVSVDYILFKNIETLNSFESEERSTSSLSGLSQLKTAVKIFECGDKAQLESDVNGFLSDSTIKYKDIKYFTLGGQNCAIVVYEQKG